MSKQISNKPLMILARVAPMSGLKLVYIVLLTTVLVNKGTGFSAFTFFFLDLLNRVVLVIALVWKTWTTKPKIQIMAYGLRHHQIKGSSKINIQLTITPKLYHKNKFVLFIYKETHTPNIQDYTPTIQDHTQYRHHKVEINGSTLVSIKLPKCVKYRIFLVNNL